MTTNRLRFDGQVAIVTGAGGNPGIGRSYARLLASRGALVVVNDIGAQAGVKGCSDNASAHTVAAEITDAGGKAVADTNDLTDPRGAERLVASAIEAFGRVDILVNNAGACIYAGVDEISDDDVRMTIDTNLIATIWTCRAVWRHMRESNYGRIVNTTSGTVFGMPTMSMYSAAKAGVIAFTRTLAAEANGSGVKCNVIAPAAGTRMVAVALEESSEAFRYMEQLSPDQVAPIVAWLCHRDCSINGEVIQSVGPWTSRLVWGATAGLIDENLSLDRVPDQLEEIIGSEIRIQGIPQGADAELFVSGSKAYAR